MEIIWKTKALRDKLAYLFGTRSGSRIICSAFIGSDPLEYIAEANGVRVYCWDNVSGTSPDGIEALFQAKAIIYFVRGLHAKLYFSQERGVLLGSANLSDNAFGVGNSLKEVAVYIDDSSLVSISAIVKSFGDVKPVTADDIARYRVRYDSSKHDDSDDGKARRISFMEWSEQEVKRPWKIALWRSQSDYSAADLKAVRAQLEDEELTYSDIAAGLHKQGCFAKKGDWILSAHVKDSGQITSLKWICVNVVSSQSVMQVGRLPSGPPFELDMGFRKALVAAKKRNTNDLYLAKMSAAEIRSICASLQYGISAT